MCIIHGSHSAAAAALFSCTVDGYRNIRPTAESEVREQRQRVF